MQIKLTEKIGISIVLLCGIMWGLSGVWGQILFQNTDIQVEWLSATRMLASGIIILIFLFLKDKKKLFSIWKTSKFIIPFLIFSIFGVMSVQYTYFAAVNKLNAATATVLQYIYPVLILLYTSLHNRKIPKFYEMISIVLAFSGIILIATHGNFSSLQISPIALFWGLTSAFSFVLYTIYPKNLYAKFGLIPIMGWAFFIGGFILFFISGCFKMKITLDSYSFGLISAISLLGTLIPFLIYGVGVKILGNLKASVLVTVEPITSAILAFILTDVKFTKVDILGFTCILCAVELIALQDLKNKNIVAYNN